MTFDDEKQFLAAIGRMAQAMEDISTSVSSMLKELRQKERELQPES